MSFEFGDLSEKYYTTKSHSLHVRFVAKTTGNFMTFEKYHRQLTFQDVFCGILAPEGILEMQDI